MENNIDYNVLFLQVMAHDLLAPLTAIKWQVELLEGHLKNKEKTGQYLQGIADSTELGISLARHAHVAAKIFSNSYEGLVEEGNLSEQAKIAIDPLYLQFERHGLTLRSEVQVEDRKQNTDEALLKLFVWSIAKFFLTVTPPGTKVDIQGEYTQEEKFCLKVRVPNVPDRDMLSHIFSGVNEIEGTFDQKYVFVKLIQEISPKLHVDYIIETQTKDFQFTATFSR
jgi:K+-sensing histidine kinase KdpD